jgi:nucleoside-diphosphate-sugar epimerase
MAFLSPDYKAALIGNPVVECVQADISDDGMCDDAFREARSGGSFDFVVHAAMETTLGKRDEFYAKGVDGAVKAATRAAAAGCRSFVFLSTAQVYKPSTACVAEDGKQGPWTAVAEASARAEAALAGVAGLRLIVLRPALVYGPGDFTTGLMPRAVVAAAYKVRARLSRGARASHTSPSPLHACRNWASAWT